MRVFRVGAPTTTTAVTGWPDDAGVDILELDFFVSVVRGIRATAPDAP